jgi:hypothetical protein
MKSLCPNHLVQAEVNAFFPNKLNIEIPKLDSHVSWQTTSYRSLKVVSVLVIAKTNKYFLRQYNYCQLIPVFTIHHQYTW